MNFSCPYCEQSIVHNENSAGKNLSCPQCSQLIHMPECVPKKGSPVVRSCRHALSDWVLGVLMVLILCLYRTV